MKIDSLDFLNTVGCAEDDLRALEIKLRFLEQDRTFVNAARSDRNSLTSTYGNAVYEKTCDKIADLKREIEIKRGEVSETRQRVIGVIQRLDNPVFVRLLIMRYVEGLPFSRIIDALGYSRSSVYRFHRTAVDALGDQLTLDNA